MFLCILDHIVVQHANLFGNLYIWHTMFLHKNREEGLADSLLNISFPNITTSQFLAFINSKQNIKRSSSLTTLQQNDAFIGAQSC